MNGVFKNYFMKDAQLLERAFFNIFLGGLKYTECEFFRIIFKHSKVQKYIFVRTLRLENMDFLKNIFRNSKILKSSKLGFFMIILDGLLHPAIWIFLRMFLERNYVWKDTGRLIVNISGSTLRS